MPGKAVAILVTLCALATTASAAWQAAGSAEPSTSWDVADGRMFPSADTQADGRPRVYFQGFQVVEDTTLNPNLAAAGTTLRPPGPAHHRAMLGLWKDCNRDSTVGLAESALLEYRSESLVDDTVCPPGGLFNDGAWVSEMIGIGMVDPCEFAHEEVRATTCNGLAQFHRNERVLYANGTMVWADVGAPGDLPPSECSTAPPPGTTSGVALFLAYLDCHAGGRAAEALLVAGIDPAAAPSLPVTAFGGADGPGLLEAGTGEPSATLWDCGAPRETTLHDPTGLLRDVPVSDPTGGQLTGPQPALPVVGTITLFEDADEDPATPGTLDVSLTDEEGTLLWAPAVAPAVHDPTGSAWDAAEHAADGPRGGCDGRTAAHAYAPGPLVESGSPTVLEARKDRASFAFTFYDGHRGLNERIDFVLGPTTPSDAGLIALRHGRGGAGPLWSADEGHVNGPEAVTRGMLDDAPPAQWTYYAFVGEAALAAGARLPDPTTAVYGDEACEGALDGVRDGWVCDPALWYRDALGRDATPRYFQGEPYAPVPGQLYHLRDVDADGPITGT